MADEHMRLLPLNVGSFITYEEYFSHFEVELYSSKTPKAAGGGIDISRQHEETKELKGARSGYMYISGTCKFKELIQDYYYYIRYRVVTMDGRISPWKLEQQRVGDDTISFVLDGSQTVVSSNGIITVSITPNAIPSDFKQILWYVRATGFSATISPNTIPDYITDKRPASGTFTLEFSASENKRVYFIAIDQSGNRHKTSAEYIGTVAELTAVVEGNITSDYINGVHTLTVDYNDYDTHPDIKKMRVQYALDNSATYTKELVRDIPINASDSTNMKFEIPAEILTNNAYLDVAVSVINSIGMESVPTAKAGLDATVPTVAVFGGVAPVVYYEKGKIKIGFNATFTDPNDIVTRFRVEVTEDNSDNVVEWEIPRESQTAGLYAYEDSWETQHGEMYTVKVYALDFLGLESTAQVTFPEIITAPYDMQDVTQICPDADIFHFDKMGYGSVRGIYPTTIGYTTIYPPQLESAKFGSGIEINGTEYLDYANSTLVAIAAGSISFWWKADADHDVIATDKVFWEIWTAADDRWNLYYDATADCFKLYLIKGAGITTVTAAELAFNTGEFVFICVTWDATLVNLYIRYASTFESQVDKTKRVITLPTNIRIGANNAGSLQPDGVLDELIFWKDVTLTQNQVKKVSELEVPNIYPNPIKAVAPAILPANDFIYSQFTALKPDKMSAETYNKMGQRFTGRNIQ